MTGFSKIEMYFIASRAEDRAMLLCELHGRGLGLCIHVPFVEDMRRIKALQIVAVN